MAIKCSKGYTLIETLISLGLIFMMVFAVATLALGYSRYQAQRLERSLIQENFRNVVSIISEEVQQKGAVNIKEPEFKGMSSELFLLYKEENGVINIIRYHIQNNIQGGTESQVFRKVYNNVNVANWENWRKNINSQLYDENEPVSDKIKAVSHLLFTYSEGMVIFITGETANGTIVTYVGQVFPRN